MTLSALPSSLSPSLPLPHHANKTRIFLALYTIAKAEPGRYHWALWLEEPSSTSLGHSFAIKIPDRYSNDPIPPPPWLYHLNRPRKYTHSPHMLGRILIGKLPKNVRYADLERLLSEVELPEGGRGCRDWLMDAVRRSQDEGILERFDVKGLFREAAVWGLMWMDELREGEEEEEEE